MNKSYKIWTMHEDRVARSLRSKGYSLSVIGERLKRDRSVISKRLRRPPMVHEGRHYISINRPGAVVEIPEAVEDERNRRLSAPHRDLTAAIFNDPKPGWSALERRA